MSKATKSPDVSVRIVKTVEPAQQNNPVVGAVLKAAGPTQLNTKEARSAGEFVSPTYDMVGLGELVKNSNILPQCIHAYKNNIAGFGIDIRYTDDTPETPEMKAEWERMREVLDLLTMDCDTKELFEDMVEAREKYGIAYLEVMRDPVGHVNAIDFINDTPSVQKTFPLDPPILVDYLYKGKPVSRPRKFCRYKQDVGGKTVHFKEFGDPRTMDNRSGAYTEADKDGTSLPEQYIANEILAFTIGTEAYGEVRWLGQVLGVDGSRKAESLNNNYFTNGRHTPLMITVSGGSLTDESWTKLQEYMNGIRGEAGQHAFLVLEVADADNSAEFEEKKPPEIKIENLASVLQKDELFQEYISNNRKRVQSAFQLPDLYVGYSTDFNRATAQTAMEVTEEQVFQPERVSLAWTINHQLLNGYGFKYTEAYFLAPKISNMDDLFKILTIAERAGGLTPNKAKDIAFNATGGTAEDFAEGWGDTPLAYAKVLQGSQLPTITPGITEQLEKQIAKAAAGHDDAVVAVMKEVRAMLAKMQEHGSSAEA